MASDAAYENSSGTGGFLLAMDDASWRTRSGKVVRVQDSWYNGWQQRETYIAQLELAMVLVALLVEAEKFRGRCGVWFIDNIAALHALCNGDSHQEDLNAMAEAIHAITFSHRCSIYYEWIESEANWADGVSRYGRHDDWLRRHNFEVHDCTAPGLALRLPLRASMTLARFM